MAGTTIYNKDLNILGTIDLNKNQMIQMVLEVLSSAPGTPSEGQMYYNSTDETAYIRVSTAWLDLGLGFGSDTLGPDGDKGDITVGGSGTTLTIDNDAVTYAKMQNVVANNVILGNNSGAGGIVDELSGTEVTALLDLFATGSTTQGLVPGSNSGGAGVYLDGSGSWSSPGGGFADFDAGGDSGADVTINSGDLYDVVGSTGITTTVSKASTTVTLSVDLDDTAVTPGSYGSASEYVTILIDQQGRITSASEGNISITESQISNLGTGVTMNADTDVSSNAWVLDEDNMSSNSATKLATQQSIKAYVDSAVTSGMTYKGGYNASTNIPALDTGSPVLVIGDTYTVTAAGTFFTEELEIGDVLIAEVDSVDAAALADWTILQKNLDQAVIGPASAVNNNVVLFDGTSGTLIKDSGLTLSGTNTGDETNASTTVAGIVEEATQTEFNNGTASGGTGARLFVNPSSLGTSSTLANAVKYTESIGNGALTTITVTHSIGRRFVTAQVFLTASTYDLVECEIELTSTTTTTFKFNTAPTTDEYTVVIVG